MNRYNYYERHRRIANLIMLISSIFSTVTFLLNSLLPYPCSLPEELVFSANLSFDLFFLGLYLKSCYRFVWSGSIFTKSKVYVCIVLPIIVLASITVREIYAPSMIGPVSWLCREYGFGWFYNWRLWWITSIVDQALIRSTLIIYLSVLVRKIVENYSRIKVDKNDING